MREREREREREIFYGWLNVMYYFKKTIEIDKASMKEESVGL